MANLNRKCLLCGHEYEYCPTCARDANKPIWYRNYHDENCKTIFHVLCDFNADNISQDEAREILAGCNLSRRSSWSQFNKDLLARIMKNDGKRK